MIKSQFRRSRASIAAGAALLAGAVLTQGCLQREVKKQDPTTSNVFVGQINNAAIDKIDLLFVVDNSVSMADKQEILALAVPEMVKRLVNPLCVDADGNTVENPGEPQGCPDGFAEEFSAVDDIHIGVISSSLGGHGSRSCPRVDTMDPTWKNDDQGHLIGSVRDLPEDFLTWTGGGIPERDALVTAFTAHVRGPGEKGCGFEAPLEAWYRFLVDPQPPQEIVLDANGRAVSTGVDPVVLAQRQAFLRPDGLVAIVILSDENDCSAMDGGVYSNASYGYLVADTSQNFRVASSVCDANPNDPCCFSCLQPPPAECSAYASECADGARLPDPEDRPNSRCFQNKRRFGVDLLYPTQRYVDALREREIVDARDGSRVNNPLLVSPSGVVRDEGLVFFAGIVGVPWQDIATDESLADPATMKYRTAYELNVANVPVTRNGAQTNATRWEVILGNPGVEDSGVLPVLPDDPFMIESIVERPAGLVNPISGDTIVDSTSTNPAANNINGHEANHMAVDNLKYSDGGPAADDLQYACIFPLATPKTNCAAGDLSCDCGDEPLRNRPLCQPPAGGAATTTQSFGKAYPGLRILQVLRDFGDNSIVGSICPKISTGVDPQDPDFGYNPAVQAIVDRLAEKLAGKCLPRELSLNPDGTVPCQVIEAAPPVVDGVGVQLDCNSAGREPVNEVVDKAVREYLESAQRCGGNSGAACKDYQLCKLVELTGAPREQCLTDASDPSGFNTPGFCYVDPALTNDAGEFIAGGEAASEIVKNCPATSRRLLRFAGEDTPIPNSLTVVACTGDAVSKDAPIPGEPMVVVEEAAP